MLYGYWLCLAYQFFIKFLQLIFTPILSFLALVRHFASSSTMRAHHYAAGVDGVWH